MQDTQPILPSEPIESSTDHAADAAPVAASPSFDPQQEIWARQASQPQFNAFTS